MPGRGIRHLTFLVLVATILVVRAPLACVAEPAVAAPRIVALGFRCAQPLDTEGLSRLIPLRVGQPLRAADLAESRRRLEQKEIFTGIDITSQPRDDGVAIVIQLVRKPIVNAIRIHGNHTLSDDQLRRGMRLYEGAALTDDLRDYAVQRVRDRYVEEGFDAATVSAAVQERSPGEVDVIFYIDEGDPLRVGSVAIAGDLPIPAADIRAAVKVKDGDRYVRAKQREAQAAIVRLFREKHYYEVQVNGSWELGEGRRGILRFKIDPGPLHVIDFSGNKHFSDDALLGLMDLPGRPIVTDGTWRELARRARQAYQKDGYYRVQIDLHIEPGPPRVIRFAIAEGRVFHVGEVKFDGNHDVSDDELRAPMATRPPSWVPWRRGVFLDEVFDDDLKRLWYLYRRHGFESAEIVDARTSFDEETGSVTATVVIDEGPQTIVQHIEHQGFDAIATQLPDLQTKEGEPLNPDQIEADRRTLVTAFSQAGFTKAAVTSEIKPESGGAKQLITVRFVAVAGAPQQIGTIIVQNNIDTHASVLVRELPFKRGDPLNPDELLRGQSNIYRLGLFRSVTVRPLEGSSDPLRPDVGVSVAEKPAGTMQWGAGYNTRDGFRGFVEVGHSNLQGLARRLSLRGEGTLDPTSFTPDQYLGNLGFREPRLDDTLWTFRANLIAQRSTQTINQFSFERYALIPAIERTLLPGLQVGLESQIEQSQVFDVAPDVLLFNPRDRGRLRSVSLGPFLVFDGRDDAFLPRRGVFDSLRLRYAPQELGSDVPFLKILGQHTQYIPLDDDLTFVYAVRGGWARAFSAGDAVPIRERFFLGGRTTVRGFGENVIGPRGSRFIDALGRQQGGNHPLGGDLVLNLNTEIRFPLYFGFGGAVFVDGGGAYLQDRAVSINDFRRSTGVGLRYITPVGPLSLEYGFKLDRRSGESIGEVHFSIGNIF